MERAGVAYQSDKSASPASQSISDLFADICTGMDVECEFEYPPSPPTWLDEDLYDRGIKFYEANFVGIAMSNGEALVSGLCIPSFYKALTFSGETSSSKREALVRYRDTALHIFYNWYRSKPWKEKTPASGSFTVVNKMHGHVANKIREAGETFEQAVKEKSVDSIHDPQARILFSDLNNLKQEYLVGIHGGAYEHDQPFPKEYYCFVDNNKKFTQFDMFLVQCSFFGGVLLYPSWYGCARATDEELLGFLHVWRVFGYYLGIHDRYNGAQFGVEWTRSLGFLALDKVVKPCCLNIQNQTIHLGQKIFRDPCNYYVWVYRNYYMMDIELRELWQSFSWKQLYYYYARYMFTAYIYPIPLIKQLVNALVTKMLNKVMARKTKMQKQQ